MARRTRGNDRGADRLPIFSPGLAYWNQRAALDSARDRIRILMEAVNRPSDLLPSQWAQLMAVTLEFAPDLIIELGRGYGNSTCAFAEASNMLGGRTRVLSLCRSDSWEDETLPRLTQVANAGWFQPLEILRTDILQFDYARAIAGARRVMIFWDAHGFEVAECVLGGILPLLAPLENLVIMHDMSDSRYVAEHLFEYKGCGIWKGNDWSGPRLKLGNIDSAVEQSISAIDFTTRNHLTLESADHSYHTDLTDEQRAELQRFLRDLFDMQAHWFYFSLNEQPGPYNFPKFVPPPLPPPPPRPGTLPGLLGAIAARLRGYPSRDR